MNKSTLRRFKLFDIGGVPPTHTVDGDINEFRSVQGGILSIIIMILSASYTIYILITWIQGQIVPKSQTSTKTQALYHFSFDYNPISFFISESTNQIDPFQNDQIILIPIVSIIKENSVLPPDVLQASQDKLIHEVMLNDSSLTKSKKINFIKDLSFVHNPNANICDDCSNINDETQYLVSFLKCQPFLLKQNQSCADESLMETFFNLKGKIIGMSVYFKEFVESSQTFVTRTKSYYFLFDDTQGLYAQVIMRIKQMKVQRGLLFQTTMKQSYLQSVEVQTQTISKNEIKKLYGSEGYAFFLIRLDSVKEFETISYPTLGEVGASIGSIVNILLLGRLLIILYNEKRFQKKLMSVISSLQTSNNNQQKDTSNPTNPVITTDEKEMKHINIFNLHIELNKMRLELNQLMQDKNDQKQQDNTIINLSDKQIKISQKPEFIPNNSGNDDDSQIFTPVYPDLTLSYGKTFIKQPDKSQEIELCLHNQVILIGTNQKITPKPNLLESKIKKDQLAYLGMIENMEHYQKYEIYVDESGR